MKSRIIIFICFTLYYTVLAFDDSKNKKFIVINNEKPSQSIVINQSPPSLQSSVLPDLQTLANNQQNDIKPNIPVVETNVIKPIRPIVSTKYGDVEGFNHLIDLSQMHGPITADIFLGIPYAKPPINKLRFEVS